jgi:hypothetical protein
MSSIGRETRKPVPREHTFKLQLSDDEGSGLRACDGFNGHARKGRRVLREQPTPRSTRWASSTTRCW